MAFWNRREKRATSGLQFPSDWLTDSLTYGPVSSAGTRVNVTNALGLSPVWAAVKIISESVNQLPFKVYRDVGDGEKTEARSHRAWRLLHDRPNANTPAGRFWATVTVHLLLYGNVFIRKLRDEAGVVDELVLLHPSTITIEYFPLLGDKQFIYRPSNLQERPQTFDDEDVLHIFGMSLDGICGLSVIETCRQSIGTAIARDEFEGEFYANGGIFSQVVYMKGRIRSDESLKRFKDTMKALFTGRGKRHGIPVLEDGAELHQVGSPMKDLEFVAAQNMTRTDIAVMFNLPPNKLGGSSGDSLTYSTVEMNQTAIAVDAVAPVCKTISDAVSQDPSLLPQNVMSAEFVLEAMMRADAKSRGEFYQALSAVKAITPDEIRKRENMPALSAGQRRELNPPPPQPALPGMEEALTSDPSGAGETDGP